MRLTDMLFRQGHLSDRAVNEALLTGERPAHLDRCDLCSQRAAELNRWLDEIRTIGVDAADDVFTPERLAAQHAQILRKIEQVDEPPRVISFPAASKSKATREGSMRRVAPAWVGVAAAAGLALGVVGGQLSARLTMQPVVITQAPATAAVAPVEDPAESDTGVASINLPLVGEDHDDAPTPLQFLNEITPKLARSGSLGG